MLWTLTLVGGLAGLSSGCASTTTSGQGNSTTSGNKFLAFLMQPSAKSVAVQRNDPTALFSKKTKPGPDLYVTMAQLREQAGDVADAESLYQKGLKADPKSLAALMGYAHLEDRRGNLEAASKLYKRAIAAHPNEIAPYNDLGLCFHRQGKLNESAQTLRHAVELAPDRLLYHNNLAMVLVDQDRSDDALKELSVAGVPAAAHYNLASLLHRKGDDAAAVDHFRLALAADPSMDAAQQWLARLAPAASSSETEALLAGRPSHRSRPVAPEATVPVVSPGEVNPPPAAPATERSVQPAEQPAVQRGSGVRTVKSDPPRPRRGAAPAAPTPAPALYAERTPPTTAVETPAQTNAAPPAAVEVPVAANAAPPAPIMETADPAGALPPAGRPDRVASTSGRATGRVVAPQAPSPPQFLYAEGQPPVAPSAGCADPPPRWPPDPCGDHIGRAAAANG